MSIIVDALERVQSERHDKHHHAESIAFESGKEAPEIDHYSIKKLSNTKIFISILFLAFVINLYLMSSSSNQSHKPFPIESNISTPLPKVKTVGETNKELKTRNNELIELNSELTESEIDIERPLESDEEFFATFEDEVPPQFEPTIFPSTTEPSITEPEVVEAQTTGPLTITAEEFILDKEEPSFAVKPNIPEWIISGKKEFLEKNIEAAAIIWNKGFSSLPAETAIISIMINHVADLASSTLNTLFINQVDAFSVHGLFKGKPAYFTLTIYPESNGLNLIANIEQQTNGKPYKTTQHHIQNRIDQLSAHILSPPINTSSAQKDSAKKPVNNITKRKKTKPLTNEKRMRIAQEAILNGDYRDAILKLRPVLFNDKNNWEVLFWIGSAKLGLGLYNEASDYFKKALALNSNIPQLWTQRAIISQENNDHIGALRFLHKAQTLSPNSPEIILNIAYSNDALGDRTGAVFSYREFLSLTQGNSLFAQQRQAVNLRLEQLGF